MEVIASILGTILFFIIYKLFTGFLPDITSTPEEIHTKHLYKTANKERKKGSTDIAYDDIKDLPDGSLKDQMLSDIAIKLSKAGFHELAVEAINSINDQSRKGLCILSGELEMDTLELANKNND